MKQALCFVGIILFSCFWNIYAAQPILAPAADVLIIHDSLPGSLPSGVVIGNNILDLLGHFGLKGALVSFNDYKTGELKRHRFVIVLGVDDRKSECPPQLVADIRSTSIPVFWIEKHLGEIANAEFSKNIGFRAAASGVPSRATSVNYKGKSLPKADPTIFPVEILDKSKIEVKATASSGSGAMMPYVLRSGSFWYCADSPFAYTEEGDRYLVFCDLLHDFLSIPHQEERKALLRLEDISIDDDMDDLRDLADYLHERNVPFQISLIPIFRDPADNSEVFLSDRPAFVRTIQHMVSKGGLVVLHGVYHQYNSALRSADDYEFWDDAAGKPIQGDSPDLVKNRLRLGLEECFKNGIYPVTWETPHYGASALDYQTFARFFSTSYESVLSLDNSESGHAFPYPSLDRYGRLIIPECLGYINAEKPDPDRLVANADRLQVVRDGVASFFFHPFLDRTYLERAIDGIEKLGYKFISIRDYDCRVQLDDFLVQTFTETVHLPIKGHYLHRFLLNSDGRVSAESYSQKPLTATYQDPGVVPPETILVMEGLTEITHQKESLPIKNQWSVWWERLQLWIKSLFQGEPAETISIKQPEAVVLWDDAAPRGDWNDQKSYEAALSAFGFRVRTRKISDFTSDSLDTGTILVAPNWSATRLSEKQARGIEAFVRRGGRIVLEGPSALSQALGVRAEKRSLRVKRVEDTHYGIWNDTHHTREYSWNPPADVVRVAVSGQISVYARDKESEIPLAVLAQFGQGRLLYLGARLDIATELGYSRFPYFVHYVRDGFDVALPLQRPQLEMYFDPGISNPKLEQLAIEWRRLGVRILYAAAYQFWPKWSYDYAHLIDVCHQNGILVYAWFELPHVSVKFWEEHPEWRAKTATGKDAGNDESSWRYHMDLDIPDCQEAAFDFAEDLIKKLPWDGVNIAELNYDTMGPEDPASYTPMGALTRSAFKAIEGFDPLDLFRPGSPHFWKSNTASLRKFEEYRVQRTVAWHRSLLEKITPIAMERDMEIIVTMLDSLHSATVTRDTGIDSHRIVALMDQYPFTLQVEDPAQFWAQSPDRYKRFGETYLKLVPDRNRLMFDINVVADRNISHSHSPTETATGIELAQSLIFATLPTGRAAIYSEGTVPFEDLQLLSKVLARDARLERQSDGWLAESDKPITVNTPGAWQNFRVNDTLWPAWGENFLSLPAGKYRITPAAKRFTPVDTSVLDLRLLRFTGNLESIKPTSRGVEFAYESSTRVLALFNRRPFEIHVDGNVAAEAPVPDSGANSVHLPSGRHTVDVLADDTAMVILGTTSLYSSSLIFIFGSVACGVMALLYLAILTRRTIRRAKGGRSD
jgi:uncharacterized protein YdaL